MARHFSIPSLLRHISTPLAKVFFEHHRIDIDPVVWKSIKKTKFTLLHEAIIRLERARNIEIESALRDIFDLGSQNGRAALRAAADYRNVGTYLSEIPHDYSDYEVAMWSHLHYSSLFETALHFLEIDTSKWWRKRNDVPKGILIANGAMQLFKDSASDILQKLEGRGNKCTVESVVRGATTYVFLFADDHVERFDVHDENGVLQARPMRPTFVTAIAYDRESGTLDLCGSLSKKMKTALEIAFAKIVLGCDIGEWSQRPNYYLDHLVTDRNLFPVDPEDELEVTFQKVEFKPPGTNDLVALQVDPDSSVMLTEKLTRYYREAALPPTGATVTHAKICIRNRPSSGHRGWSMTFEIAPRADTLRNHPDVRIKLAQKYFRKWKILRVPGDEALHGPVAD